MSTALPPGWITRRPTLEYVPALLALVHASDIEAIGEPDFSPEEVREALTEKPWIEALIEAGFAFLKQHARMTMSLAGIPHTAPEPPAGITIRPINADDDGEMRRFHATIAEAFLDSDHHATRYDEWFAAWTWRTRPRPCASIVPSACTRCTRPPSTSGRSRSRSQDLRYG